MRYTAHYDPALVPGSEELLKDALLFILNGYRPALGQDRIENEDLMRLTRNIPTEAVYVIERSQVWVSLEES